jgi:hypothetical protein
MEFRIYNRFLPRADVYALCGSNPDASTADVWDALLCRSVCSVDDASARRRDVDDRIPPITLELLTNTLINGRLTRYCHLSP